MHVFLTGEIGSGKSTVIKKILTGYKSPFGGFCTSFGDEREKAERRLFINDAAREPVFTPENAVAVFSKRSVVPMPERFDALGTAYIEAAGSKTLIIMDECGYLERGAKVFQNAILTALNWDTPVLGVVKPKIGIWTDGIKNHPNVKLLEVTAKNRDGLPAYITSILF